jgi:hypothetical protein
VVGQILSCNFRILVHCTLPQILSAVCCSGREWCFSENTFRLAMRARDSAFSTLTIINSEVLVLRYPDIKYAKNPRSAIMAFALYFLPPTLPGPSSRCSVFQVQPLPDTPKRLLTSRFAVGTITKTPILNLHARGRLIPVPPDPGIRLTNRQALCSTWSRQLTLEVGCSQSPGWSHPACPGDAPTNVSLLLFDASNK